MNMQPTPTTDYQLLSSWLTVIGMLTMDWSPVERHIDQCVHFLHGKLTLSKKQKKKPTRLGSKLEFIKCNMPPEIFDQNGFECLVNRTKDTVRIRDVCVHGVLNSYDHSKIEIGKIDSTKDGHHIENFTIDLGTRWPIWEFFDLGVLVLIDTIKSFVFSKKDRTISMVFRFSAVFFYFDVIFTLLSFLNKVTFQIVVEHWYSEGDVAMRRAVDHPFADDLRPTGAQTLRLFPQYFGDVGWPIRATP